MSGPETHIVFTVQAQGQLIEALQILGRDARVVAMYDDYSLGPIAPDDPDVRSRWMHENLYNWLDTPKLPRPEAFAEDDTPSRMRSFWRRSLAPAPRRVAWVSRRCPDEYVGFVVWLSRMEGDAEVVDMTDTLLPLRLRDGTLAIKPNTISHMGPAAIVNHHLLELARPIDQETREHGAATWARLQAENTLVRTIEAGEVVSVGLDHYDDLLLQFVGRTFKRTLLVVTEFWWEMEKRGVLSVDHSWCMTRIMALVESGRLQGRGKLELAPREIRRL
ncbi:DUF3658 domain-containing protein [Phenylobacterium terrae]|uniref:DUF3658 domain-containing protein n=1 Tax=Phenylobacterium terrae TaxID=2665495 RepID=A0ABW4N7P9_9CAUL